VNASCGGGQCPVWRNPVIAALPAEIREKTLCLFRRLELEAGTPLYMEGLPAHSVFALRTGRCKAVQVIGGREHVLRAYGPGDLVGLEALITDEYAHSVFVTAKATVCHAPKTVFSDTVLSSSLFAEAILSQFGRELLENRELLASVGSPGALGRVARLLLTLRDRDAGPTQDGYELIELPLNRRDTAAMLGMAEESLSRQLTTLEKVGVLRRKGRRLLLLDLDGLEVRAQA